MMTMVFELSDTVTLLFDFWDVRGPAGMVLSVFVVFLLTVFYEVLKVWRVWLGVRYKLSQHESRYASSPSSRCDNSSVLENSPSESSLTPIDSHLSPPNRHSLLMHITQTVLHMMQVSLGYMLMLCVMSYNFWVFIGVIGGSTLGYFISFPLLDHM
ncbi:probable low affinity copper uptake protein 2 [Notolabrus celidotus]|uniref:probable low affinity copper uptake protein 2 n=1 Tax=Notolabrus celidotus TaxID=1203425 RepID=UPI00148F6F35|nr:probable low affinity copper uptake protein 2 [Notolabrus celidotus]XP_034565005.1 probable low affinity copper uptake protein 2 [Notolabrus celidotus]